MRCTATFTLIALIALSSFASAQDFCGCGNFEDPTLTFSGEALMLWRDQNYAGPLVFNETTMAPALTGDDVNYGGAGGTRLTLHREVQNGWAFEAVYFGMNDWSSNYLVTGNNNISLPGDAGIGTFDFFAADAMGVALGSKIQNVELNVTKTAGNLQLLAGFRFFGLTEDLTISSYDADTFLSDYRVKADNHLYGGQLGARYHEQWNRLSLYGETKLGIYDNSSDNSTLFRDLNNTLVLRNTRNNANSTSFVGELRFGVDYLLTEHLHATLGYNMLWVTDVALAPYQLDFTDTMTSSQFLDDSHSVFYHGINVGLVATF
ncbi:BBP7 family outer membrane beta-barrel protein [Blastopirellula sp. JC732]|uniref:BBP7 family outer membrane beta-barrel protein n=1 Tax=Blastopirellula sediminis TaxID=2894196 RepID=A0A9X1MMA9_9BACT|nr:BBP7 family outer membrane beta-barrel protein [Blastopirellula sediminis]MCC9608378.1 BBP7 family outer membrane beta-barrel protein [Blastopirellula sediminis]MCC9628845.1 BBP7 family outer membrane beta-barrel protein [Blastopirellula sediminis]